jgi:5-methylcytosine-specific restriction enzyme B
LRGPTFRGSRVAAVLPEAEGLNLDLDALVRWTTEAIQHFELTYTAVAKEIGADEDSSDEEVLSRFDSKLAFRTFRASWSVQARALFARLARAVHTAGLDWWHIGQGIQVRFGRKDSGQARALSVLGLAQGNRRRTITFGSLGDLEGQHRALLDEALVSQIEAALKAAPPELQHLAVNRPGLWPDEIEEDVADAGDAEDFGAGGQKPSEPDDGEAPEGRSAINQIYYGPPGTGKTWRLRQLLERYERNPAAVSAESWRAHFIQQEIVTLTWWEGIAAALHELGGRADVSTMMAHPFLQAIAQAKGRTQNVRQTLWGTLQSHAVEHSETVRLKQRIAPPHLRQGPAVRVEPVGRLGRGRDGDRRVGPALPRRHSRLR